MRLSTLIKIAVLAVLAVAVALITVIKSIDFDRYKGFLATQVAESTGRRLTIAGPLELQLGLVPTVSASGIAFANATWGTRPDMVSAERVVAKVALLPLLTGKVVVRRLELVGPDILLETAADGRGNWSLGSAPPRPAAASASQAGTPPTSFDIGEIRIRDARVTWHDGATGQRETMTLDHASVQPDGTGAALAIEISGAVGGKGFDLAGSVGAPALLAAGKPWPIHLKGSTAGALLVADGTMADPAGLHGVDIRLTARGDDVATLMELAGHPWAGGPIGPFKLSAHLGDPGGRLGIDGLDAAAGRHDTVLAAAKGTVLDLRRAEGIDLAVAVEGDSLAGLGRLAGVTLPAAGPVTLAARLSDGSHAWRLEDIKGRLGGSDLAGDLHLDTGARLHLGGRLAFGRLVLDDFTAAAGATPAKPGDGRLIPADPLPLAALREMDADVALSAAHVMAGRVDLADTSAKLRLDRGRLSVEPVSARTAGGTVTATLAVDAATGHTTAANVRLDASDVDLGRLLAAATGKAALTGGPTRLHIAVRGKGESLRALAASLDGEAVAKIGAGRLAGSALDWAGGDLLMQVLGSLNPLAKSASSAELHCAVMRFAIRNGVATSDQGIAAETDKVTVIGSGTVDLRDEALDIAVTPRARGGIGVNLGGGVAGLTRVRGTLASPTIAIDEAGAARTAASVGAAMATGGLSLLGEMAYDKATADDHPCRTALAGRTGKRHGSLLDGLFGR